MKHKYILSLFVFLFLFRAAGYSQPHNPFVHAVKARNGARNSGTAQLMKGAVEVPSKRTLFSSTYKTPGGKIICRYSSHQMNYPDANGKLQPINIELHSDSKGWIADQQPVPCYFHSDGSTAISLGKGEELGFNMESSINGSAFDENITSLTKDVVSLDLSYGIHKKITFAPYSIETDYIIDSSLGTKVTITEGLKYPAGYKIVPDKARGRESKDGWCGDYILVSGKNNSEIARFHAPLCYDSKENWCIGSYSTIVKDGKTILITAVPSEWLSKAVYPIVIDPLVTGTTSKWTGGTIASCIFPSFSSDSIYVTIPGKITITDFIVNYAYQANANIPVYIPDGKFYFHTACGGNIRDTLSCDQTVSEETMSGYCFLDTTGNDFHVQLTCCYPPSCDSQSFYLSQHLSRLSGGSGCDTNWIWYSGFINPATWFYQFMATVVGNTVQPDSVNPITLTPASQCSNVCSLKMKVNVNYGVPPYKISHPWDSTRYTAGSYSGCNSTGTTTFTLTIPSCPTYCQNNDTIIIPPPLVIDYCGDTATGWPVEKFVMKATPKIIPATDTLAVCNGAPIRFTLNSCIGGTTFTWTGSNASSGNGSIDNTPSDTSAINPDTVVYKSVGTVNGCSSDTVKYIGIVNPNPSSVIVADKDTIPYGTSDNLSVSGGSHYSWKPATGLSCDSCPNPMATPSATTVYTVVITNKEGCTRTDSIKITVFDEQLVIPNTITPNGDGINDYFMIRNLQYYPNSTFEVFDRWGKQIYKSTNYANDWDGGGQSDGVYYYLLTLNTGKKYGGFFQLIK